MPEFINDITSGWKKELENNEKLKKLWGFFELYDEDEEGELTLQVRDEWEDFINVYQISISVTKLEFENNEKAFTPFLCVRKTSHTLDYKRYDKLADMDDIMYKLEDFVAALPKIKEKEEEKEEEEEDDDEEEEEEEDDDEEEEEEEDE